MEQTVALLEFCSHHGIILIPKHLAGKLNRLVYMESRLDTVATEWALDYQTFQWIWYHFGSFDTDQFATRWNALLSRFVFPGQNHW